MFSFFIDLFSKAYFIYISKNNTWLYFVIEIILNRYIKI